MPDSRQIKFKTIRSAESIPRTGPRIIPAQLPCPTGCPSSSSGSPLQTRIDGRKRHRHQRQARRDARLSRHDRRRPASILIDQRIRRPIALRAQIFPNRQPQNRLPIGFQTAVPNDLMKFFVHIGMMVEYAKFAGDEDVPAR